MIELRKILLISRTERPVDLLNIKLMVLNQGSNKPVLFSLAENSYVMDIKTEDRKEKRRRIFENIFLEAMATLFVGVLILICFWILFKS